MLLQWRQDTQVALYAPSVVIANITLNHLNQCLLVGKSSAIVALTFQNAPESFHGAVVDAVCHAGHTLCHTGLFNFVMESTVRVLVSPVAVKKRMRVGIFPDSFVKGFEYERIVITSADFESHDAPVIEI